jgi:hypothetical protein
MGSCKVVFYQATILFFAKKCSLIYDVLLSKEIFYLSASDGINRIMNFFNRLINKIMQIHPLPAYHFFVEWGGARISFIEVSGLEIINDVIEHHDGSDPGR